MRTFGQTLTARFEPHRDHPDTIAEVVPDRRARRAFYTFLTVLVSFGLHMRLANPTVQHLETDQGHDHIVVWDWLRDGRWPPLVGWGMRLAGWGIILCVLGLTARSAPVAWRVHIGGA